MEDLQEEIKPKWLIKKIDNLALCYKTFFNREATKKDLEICAFNSNGTRYTIASFDWYADEMCWCLNSCCDRLNSKSLDWEVFGVLVLKGYKMLQNDYISAED